MGVGLKERSGRMRKEALLRMRTAPIKTFSQDRRVREIRGIKGKGEKTVELVELPIRGGREKTYILRLEEALSFHTRK